MIDEIVVLRSNQWAIWTCESQDKEMKGALMFVPVCNLEAGFRLQCEEGGDPQRTKWCHRVRGRISRADIDKRP